MSKLAGISVALFAVVCAFNGGCVDAPDVDSAEDVQSEEASDEVAQRDTKLSPAEIQTTVRASFGSFRACYETALKDDPKLEGNVILDFTIDGEGDVAAEIGEDSTIEDTGLKRCMGRAANNLKFAATGHETTVKYPIAFSPG